MQRFKILPQEQRPIVAVVAEVGPLAISIVESILAKFSRAKIFANDTAAWKENTKHIKDKQAIVIVKDATVPPTPVDYVLYLDSSSKKSKDLAMSLELVKKYDSKLFVVFPYSRKLANARSYQMAKKYLRDQSLALGIIFTTDLFGPRMEFLEKSFVADSIFHTLSGETIEITGEILSVSPSYIPNIANWIVDNLFSFGTIGSAVGVASADMTAREFYDLIGADYEFIVPADISTKVAIDFSQYPSGFNKADRVVIVKTNLKKATRDTLDWFRKYAPPKPAAKKKRTKSSDSVVGKKLSTPLKKRKAMVGISAALFVLLTPLFMTLISLALLYFAGNSTLTGQLEPAKKYLTASGHTASFAIDTARFFSNIPILGNTYSTLGGYARILSGASDLGLKGVFIGELYLELFQGVFSDKPTNLIDLSNKLTVELDSVYIATGFLQSELEGLGGLGEAPLKGYLDSSSLQSLRRYISLLDDVVGELPELLGTTEQKTYLVLFQNNMELRPTGGFIGSFALLTFDNGKLSSMNVDDVYSADGQLKGHVEPPPPIKEYLGEANWFLRDSNWDPDFSISAERAEWFLDKEVGAAVDGVIAVDLEFAKNLLSEIGFVYLSDFDKRIDESNLYLVTQSEVEDAFFPGSRKKANFLTALARELFVQMSSVDAANTLAVSRSVLKSLNEKNLQVFLHNNTSQKALSELNWTGAVYTPQCSGNCYVDLVGLVEANVGVNKANVFVQRKAFLEVTQQDGVLNHRLVIDYVNGAAQALGPSGVYKTYVRVLSPLGANFRDAVVYDSLQNSNIKKIEVLRVRGHSEAGVFVEVPPEAAVSVIFNWSEQIPLSFSESGEYRMYWRKQAGTLADPISISVSLPSGSPLTSFPEASLTASNAIIYNTDLARDFSSRIFW